MEILGQLANGFATFFTPEYLLLAFLGVLLGTLVGVLPGIGPVGAMSILLGFTTLLGPTAALILFAGIYYGSMYGGSTTSILLNVPGEAMSVVTAIDGHQMARRGRAGAALSISALASFVATALGIVGLSLFAPPLAQFALAFGPPEYAVLALMGMLILAVLSPGNIFKSLSMVALGLILATVGLDELSGELRFTFGIDSLTEGIGFIPLVMGAFGVAEVLAAAAHPSRSAEARAPKLRELLPTKSEARRSVGPMARGAGVGFFSGLIPGSGPVVSTFMSYALERRVSKRRDEFGKGAVEGVAGPEAANNSATAASFVPLTALGIPFTPTMALVLAALLVNGIVPGPRFVEEHSDLFWTVIASMFVGNLMLLILNLPLVGLFTRVLMVPPKVLMPLVLVFALLGVYTVNNSMLDVIVMVFAGVAAIFLRSHGYSLAALVLAVVLQPTLESALRQSLTLSHGSPGIFVTRPISAMMLAIIVTVLGSVAVRRLWARRSSEESGPSNIDVD